MIDNGMLRGDYNGTPLRTRSERELDREREQELFDEVSGLEELERAEETDELKE